MKSTKTSKKLSLRRESLRTLSSKETKQAAGGFTNKPSVYNCPIKPGGGGNGFGGWFV